MKKVCAVIWDHVHQMWLERNLDRHGREAKEQAGRARLRSLREVKMWHQHKANGLIHVTGIEKTLFYPTFEDHKKNEGSAKEVDM